MKFSTPTLTMRRAALIEQIASERDSLASSWQLAQQRFHVLGDRLTQLRSIARSPVVIATAVAIAWIVGWQRSAMIVKSVALGWRAWQRIKEG